MHFREISPSFSYGEARVRDLRTYGVKSSSTGRVTVTGIEIAGELYAPSLCFWISLLNRFQIPKSTLQLFDTEEIVERLKLQSGDLVFRYLVERDPLGNSTIVGICSEASTPKEPANRSLSAAAG